MNNTFAGFVWSAVDQEGVLHDLPHLQGVPDCGEYAQGDHLLYAFILNIVCCMFVSILLLILKINLLKSRAIN